MLAPDNRLYELLSAEHQFGRWVGKELLPIWRKVRELDGDEEDYERLVRSSHLWMSYQSTTSDSVAQQERSLFTPLSVNLPAYSAGWDLETALTQLIDRVRAFNRWPNPRTAARNRAVAIGFLTFCIEHNGYTKTVSTYEIAKYTPAISQKSVDRALRELVDLGLLIRVDEHLRGGGSRRTRRYRVFLSWGMGSPVGLPREQQACACGSVPSRRELFRADLMNMCKCSLSHDGTHHPDVWSRGGLGLRCQQVYEALTDTPVSVKALSERLGVSRSCVSKSLTRLFDVGLAGFKPEARSKLWFRVSTPLDAVAELLGVSGVADRHRQKIELMQSDQRWLRSLPYAERRNEFDRRRYAAARRKLDASEDRLDLTS